MSMARSWKDLPPRIRQLILFAGAIDLLLRAWALTDLRRRAADQVNGPKWVWRLLLALVNSMGVLPVIYFLRARRSGSRSHP